MLSGTASTWKWTKVAKLKFLDLWHNYFYIFFLITLITDGYLYTKLYICSTETRFAKNICPLENLTRMQRN